MEKDIRVYKHEFPVLSGLNFLIARQSKKTFVNARKIFSEKFDSRKPREIGHKNAGENCETRGAEKLSIYRIGLNILAVSLWSFF